MKKKSLQKQEFSIFLMMESTGVDAGK